MDRRIRAIADDISDKAFDKQLDIIIEEAEFPDDPYKRGKVILLANEQTGDIGCISTDVAEHPDQQVSYFILELQQYKYFISEGFETEDIVNDMNGQVFKNLSKEDFYKRLLSYGDE